MTEEQIRDELYRLIQNPNAVKIVSTKIRNLMLVSASEMMPMYQGYLYEIKTKNMGGGMWQIQMKLWK